MRYAIFEVLNEDGKKVTRDLEYVHCLAVAKEIHGECVAYSPNRYFGIRKDLKKTNRIIKKAHSYNHGFVK